VISGSVLLGLLLANHFTIPSIVCVPTYFRFRMFSNHLGLRDLRKGKEARVAEMLILEVNRSVSESISEGNKPLVLLPLFRDFSLQLSELNIELQTDSTGRYHNQDLRFFMYKNNVPFFVFTWSSKLSILY